MIPVIQTKKKIIVPARGEDHQRGRSESTTNPHRNHAGLWVAICIVVLLAGGAFVWIVRPAALFRRQQSHAAQHGKQDRSADSQSHQQSHNAAPRHETEIPKQSQYQTLTYEQIARLLSQPIKNNTDLYAMPFGYATSSILPAGFRGTHWGDSFETVISKLGPGATTIHREKHDVVRLVENTTETQCLCDPTIGLYRVFVTYNGPEDVEKLISALKRQFGAVPESNLLAVEQDNGSSLQSGFEAHWVGEETHIRFESAVTTYRSMNFPYKAPHRTLELMFEARAELSGEWRNHIIAFVEKDFYMLGEHPLSKALNWGMSLEGARRATTSDGKTVLEKYFVAEYSEGRRGLEEPPGRSGRVYFYFDTTDELAAVGKELWPQNGETSRNAFAILTTLYGEGSRTVSTVAPPGCEIIHARDWRYGSEKLVRFVSMKTPRGGEYSYVGFGKAKFLKTFDHMREAAVRIEDRYKF